MRRLFVFLALAFALGAQAQPVRVPSQYKRLLLPFHTGTGDFNTGFWTVEWWIRNDGPTAADAFPLAAFCGLPAPGGLRYYAKPSLPAETTLTCLAGDVLPSFPIPPIVPVISQGTGAFLYIESAAAKQIQVGGSLAWATFATSRPGTQLRAIPEEAFVTGRRSILPVPISSGRRYALRVYALPETLQSRRLQVRIYDMQPPQSNAPREPLRTTIPLELTTPLSLLVPCLGSCDLPPVDYAPASAQVLQIPVPSGNLGFSSTLRFEIVPESDAVRWWAVLSSTDNATNDVLLYEPASN